MHPRLARIGLSVVLLLLGCAASGGAQILRGVVLEQGGDRPVVGAVVTLLDAAGGRSAAVFTDDGGGFALRARDPGRYALRVDRIGYEPLSLADFELREGELLPLSLTMRRATLALRAVHVTGAQQCVPHPSAGPATARLWQDVRSALLAASLTASQRLLEARLELFTRRLDPQNGQLRIEESYELEGITESPFRSPPVEELERYGYVRVEPDRLVYSAPDAEVLLSPLFLATHCFRTRAGPPDDTTGIGLAFEPLPAVLRADVKGVLWLDRGSGELRRLEFEYTNLPSVARGKGFGGEVLFERLPDERWIIPEWVLRIPIIEVVPRRRGEPRATQSDGGIIFGTVRLGAGQTIVLQEIQEAGGRVLSHRVSGDRTPPVLVRERLQGTVFDSVAMRPLAGARVYFDGTALEVRTDAAGRFAFDSIPQGRQLLSFLHPRLDSLRIRPPVLALRLPAGESSDLRLTIPSAGRLTALACPDHPRAGMMLGHVRESDGTPVPFAPVRVMTDASARSWTLVTADARGAFRACNIPPDVDILLQAAPEQRMFNLPVRPPGPREARRTVRLARGEIPQVVLVIPDAPAVTHRR